MGVIFKNNVMYGAGDIEISPVCYSEEEREIGCWVDGKPLYQKTIHIGAMTTDTSWHTIAHNVENMETPVSAYGYVKSGTEGYWYSIPQHRANTTMGVTLELTLTTINYVQNWLNRAVDSYVTIQYTKTTDTPGSGTWTPSGVPAVHYSTDEQVVGTWIDGSTLYKKTVELSKTLSSGNNIYDVGLSDFVIHHAEGYLTSTTGQYLDMFAHLNPAGGLTYCIACWFSGGNKLYISCGSNMTGNYTGSVTVLYTKTTS